MIRTSRCIGKQFLVHGVISVPLQIASYKCEYKYALVNENEEPTYEEIIEWEEWEGCVNRYLDINTTSLSENSKLVIIRS